MVYTEQENQMINEEINMEKYNVDVLKSDIKALNDELKITNEDINHIRHLIVKQKKQNEPLKKLIVKQVIIYKKKTFYVGFNFDCFEYFLFNIYRKYLIKDMFRKLNCLQSIRGNSQINSNHIHN